MFLEKQKQLLAIEVKIAHKFNVSINFIISVSFKNNFKMILSGILKSKTLKAVALLTPSAVKKPLTNNF
jgi:hypothetical protein